MPGASLVRLTAGEALRVGADVALLNVLEKGLLAGDSLR